MRGAWPPNQSVTSAVPEADLPLIWVQIVQATQKSTCLLRTITYLHKFWKPLLVSLLDIRTFISCTCKKHGKVRNSPPNGTLLLLSKVLKIRTCGTPLKPSDRHENNQRGRKTPARCTSHDSHTALLGPGSPSRHTVWDHVEEFLHVMYVSEQALPYGMPTAEAVRLFEWGYHWLSQIM